VGSRGVRDLFVCRECGALWQTWYDQREGYQCWQNHGRGIVPVFAADTSLTRLVEWVVSDYQGTSFRLLDALATRLIRRRPEGLQEGASALLRCLSELTPPKDTAAAQRLLLLFHLLGLIVERAIRGDLRPSGPREKPPTLYRDAEVSEAAQLWRPRHVDDLTRLARTHDVIRRLMWENRFRAGAADPDHAVVALHDLSPALQFLKDLPLDAVDDGVVRGVVAQAAFKACGKLNNLGRLPENDHALWLGSDAWAALGKLLDPVERLAASLRRISQSTGLTPSRMLPCLQMESLLVREPIRGGVRFTDAARRRLEGSARKLETSRAEDGARAYEVLCEILELEKAALRADARCSLAQE